MPSSPVITSPDQSQLVPPGPGNPISQVTPSSVSWSSSRVAMPIESPPRPGPP
ncbi:hypothetical protein [Sorangium sp. So ce590]|uniref:hypothetical protein n=1 Tax=unclassified Sorangium TaxID=2621164 RepID=UPI003F5EC2FC